MNGLSKATLTMGQPALLAAMEQPETSQGLRLDAPLARAFMLAGNATFTVVSKKSGKRFTMRMRRPKDDDTARSKRALWVSVLSGSDNENDYAFLGTIWEESDSFSYHHGRRSRVGDDAPSVKAARWIADALNHPELMRHADIWHEGSCGRCGRRLTVPESIASGIGPECAAQHAE